MTLRAGAGRAPLPMPLGAAMMGYGARTGGAEAVHDPLFARAVYLSSDSDALLVECDLCLLSPAQTDAVRGRLAARTRVPPGRILVGCIHTHSGPDTGLAALLTGGEPPPHVAGILDAIVAAGAAAHDSAAPARLGLGRTEARIGRNRRRPEGPLDAEVLVLRLDRADGSPLAVLYIHGCHPTALGHDNRVYSADWPGTASAVVEEALPGAMGMFVLGAHADVDPRTRGLLDLAIPGQSVGVSFEETARLGREIGQSVAAAAASIRGSPQASIGAACERLAIPVHPGESDPEARERSLEAGLLEAKAALGLPADATVGTGELFGLEHERTRHLPREEARPRIARVRRYLRDRTAARFAGSALPHVEAQVLRLGDAWLLGLPLEPTVDVGLDWKARCAGAPAAVVSIANGWMRYLPHPRNFREPGAEAHYEILMSTLVPDAAERLLAAADALRDGLAGRGAA